MKVSRYRFCSAIGLVLVQLVIAPATQLLHVGCEHTNDATPGSSNLTDGLVRTIDRTFHTRHHSCEHCSERTFSPVDHATDPTQNAPAHPPHKDDSCPICQAAFAARITTKAPAATTAQKLIVQLVAEETNSVMLVPRDRVLNRGPPLNRTGCAA